MMEANGWNLMQTNGQDIFVEVVMHLRHFVTGEDSVQEIGSRQNQITDADSLNDLISRLEQETKSLARRVILSQRGHILLYP